MRIIQFSGMVVALVFLIFISGCLTSSNSGSGASDDSSFLIGTWAGVFDSVDGSVDTNVFYANGTGIHLFSEYTISISTGKWVLYRTDTTQIRKYGVIRGMLYFVEPGGPAAVPTLIAYWQKYALQGNVMTWYKGGLLAGGTPGVLVGNWKQDSLEVGIDIVSYSCNFKSNGVLYVSFAGGPADSMAYTVAGSKIQRRDLITGKKDTLQYEFDGNYLKIYNPSVTVSYTKVK